MSQQIMEVLLAVQRQQQDDSKVLHELKGNVEARVSSLERAATRNWWMTYVVTPFLMIAHAVARHFGVRV